MEKRKSQKDELNRDQKRRTAMKSSGGSLSESVKRAAQKQQRTEDAVTARAKEVFRRKNPSTGRARTMEEFEGRTSGGTSESAAGRSAVAESRFAQRSSGDRLGSGSVSSRTGGSNRFGSDSGSSRTGGSNRFGRDSSSNRTGSGSSRSGAGKPRSTNNTSQGTAASSRRRTSAVKRRRMEQEARRRKNRKRAGCLLNIVLLLLLFSFAGITIMKHFSGRDQADSGSEVMESGSSQGTASKDSQVDEEEKVAEDRKDDTKKDSRTTTEEPGEENGSLQIIEIGKDVLEQADFLAAQYDYDEAIAKIEEIEGYEQVPDLMDRIKNWEEIKGNLVEYQAEDVTHIFYHTLVVDTELAFECAPSIAEGFKMWMTTTEEFDRITQKMYEEGYVLCSLYDFFEEKKDEDGTPHFTGKSVYLPADKKPFILSLDDLSYYHTYTGRGMATKLVLDKNGKITCEYRERDGSVVRGSYDCVPRLNDFLDAHPDGCYRGARGTIALTGYNGIFGYRTDRSYVTRENLDKDKQDWLDAHPDYDYDKECAQAKKIAEELKEEGWDFASHTWGHIRIGQSNLARIQRDTEKWKENVEPIIGHTECIIFAHGQDLASVDEYNTATNKKYQYLTSKGFHIYLNVDSHQKTMRVHDTYVHGGRRNLDGYRLWTDTYGNSTWTNDLFDASTILDKRRKDMPNPD